jgi:hypothetical protein
MSPFATEPAAKTMSYDFVVWALVQMVKWVPFLLCSFALLIIPSLGWAALVPVKQKEGTSHGFVVLHSLDGKLLATGQLIQTIDGERITSEVVFHFRDGSFYDDVTVFSQDSEFRLISDHVRQRGPSFPTPVDSYVEVATGEVRITSLKDPKQKTEQQHLQMPEDTANGLTLILVKNLSPGDPETTVSMVAASSKPRVVKLKIHSVGEQAFSAGGTHIEATHYVIHTDIGGVQGAVANAVGKQPPDLHYWIVGGKASAFVKFTGELFEGGPIWNIELAPVRWVSGRSPSKRK